MLGFLHSFQDMILLIIFVTICLISYNDYKLAVLGNNTLIPVIDEDLEPDFTVGDLLIVKRGKLSRVEVGDVVFFYRKAGGEATINFAKITNTEKVTDTEYNPINSPLVLPEDRIDKNIGFIVDENYVKNKQCNCEYKIICY